MPTLALDVDGVLLDNARGSRWTVELERRHAINPEQLHRAFFARAWTDVVTGVELLTPALSAALSEIGTTVSVDDVIACWFETDFAPIEPAFDLARRVAAAGIPVVLATNQEHQRAAYLLDRIRGLCPIQEILYSADLGVQKRHRAFFDRAAPRLGVTEPAEIVFVDDARDNLVQAEFAGWRTVLAGPDLGWIAQVPSMLGLDS